MMTKHGLAVATASRVRVACESRASRVARLLGCGTATADRESRAAGCPSGATHSHSTQECVAPDGQPFADLYFDAR